MKKTIFLLAIFTIVSIFVIKYFSIYDGLSAKQWAELDKAHSDLLSDFSDAFMEANERIERANRKIELVKFALSTKSLSCEDTIAEANSYELTTIEPVTNPLDKK